MEKDTKIQIEIGGKIDPSLDSAFNQAAQRHQRMLESIAQAVARNAANLSATEKAVVRATERAQEERVKQHLLFEKAIARATERAQTERVKIATATERAVARATERQQRETVRQIERSEREKTRIIENETRRQQAARHAALSTLAHSLPFGIGRTLSFSALNLSDMAGGGGRGGGGGGFGAVAGGAGEAGRFVNALSASISKIPIPIILAAAAAFHVVTKAVQGTINILTPLLEKGLIYNDLIEQSRFGIAGIVSQMTDIYRGQELVTDATERWQGSLAISEDITRNLQDAALTTRAIYSELARGMQEGFAPMLQMGVQQEQITPFVTRFIHLMSTLRIPLREIGQEIRAFSNLETNPRTARASFAVIGMAAKQMGVSFEEAKAKLQSLAADDSLVEWFLENTKEFERSGKESMTTLSGQLSNIKELIDRILGEGTKELYSTLKQTLDRIVGSFTTIDSKGRATFNQDLINGIRSVARAVEFIVIAAGAAIVAFSKLIGVIKTLIAVAKGLMFPGLNAVIETINRLREKEAEEKNKAKAGFYGYGHGGSAAGIIGGIAGIGRPEQGYTFKNVQQESAEIPPDFKIIPGVPKSEQARAYAFSGKNAQYFKEKEFEVYLEELEKGKKKNEEAQKEAERLYLDWIEGNAKFIENWANKTEELFQSFKKGLSKVIPAYNLNRAIYGTPAAPEYIDPATGRAYPSVPAREGISGFNARSFHSWWNQSSSNLSDITGQMGRAITQDTLLELGEKLATEFNNEIELYWRGPMKSIFAELGTTGGRNFLNVVARNFDQLVASSIENIVNSLYGDLRVEKDSQGNITYYQGKRALSGIEEFRAIEGRQDKMNMGMGALNIGLGSYAAGRTGAPGSISGGVVGGAATGFSLMSKTGLAQYAWVGAIVGAIVGGISAALGKAAARDEYKFGIPSISSTGVVLLDRTKNIQQPEKEEMTTRLQETFDRFWNGYMRLAIDYASKILPKLSDIAGMVFIQPEASKNFLKHFDEFVNGTLPDMLANVFEPALEAIAVSLGMKSERFKEIFQRFDTLDPSKALELFGVLFSTLQNFLTFRGFTEVGSPDLPQENYFNRQVEIFGIEQRQGSYANSFADAQIRVMQLAEAVENLTGEAQIRAAHELSETLIDMMERQKELARQFASFLRDSNRSFDQLRRTMTIEGMGQIETDEFGNKVFKPDYKAQYAAEQAYLQEIMNNISTAGTLEEMQYWQQEMFAAFQRMGAIAQQGGPEMYEAYRKWLLGTGEDSGVLGQFQKAIQDRVKEWGDQIATQTNAMIARLTPFIDAFTSKINEVTGGDGPERGGLGRFGGRIEEIIPILDDFKTSLSELIPVLRELKNNSEGNSLISDGETELRVQGNAFPERVIARRLARRG